MGVTACFGGLQRAQHAHEKHRALLAGEAIVQLIALVRAQKQAEGIERVRGVELGRRRGAHGHDQHAAQQANGQKQ